MNRPKRPQIFVVTFLPRVSRQLLFCRHFGRHHPGHASASLAAAFHSSICLTASCLNEEVRSVCKGSRCLIQFLFRSSNICSGKCRTTAAVMTKASSTDDAPPSAPPPRRPRPKPPSAGAVLAQGDRDFRKPPVAVVKCQTLGVAVKLERDKNCLARETAYADDR
jgi:hypothetical protein